MAPIGCTISFVDRDHSQVLDMIEALHDHVCELITARRVPDCLSVLDPMEAPWTVEVIIDCGEWTAYLNNGMDGGDPTAIAPAVARHMGARCVTAQHIPRYGPGHAATQLWIDGPEGEPPLMGVRALSAHAEDGRWKWHESGTPQSFEHPERYRSRRIRDRLDRDLLIEYLVALGIHVDDPAFFGSGVGLRQLVDWSRREVSVADWRWENGWPELPGGWRSLQRP
jgi:hypothetical protein